MLSARDHTTPAAQAALERLCHTYWYPLYAFIRRTGKPPAEAEDLTQGFFAHLLGRDWLANVGPEKGRFRTFLLQSLKHYLENERLRESGPVRRPPGGFLPLEIETGEDRYLHEPADDLSPDKLYERQWVAALLTRITARLREHCEAAGKLALFEQLEPHLGGPVPRGVHAQVAAALGLSEGAVRTALHRLREEFGKFLRQAVAETVADPTAVEDELRSLSAAWH